MTDSIFSTDELRAIGNALADEIQNEKDEIRLIELRELLAKVSTIIYNRQPN